MVLIGYKAGIAQLVERNLAKVEVASSNLVSRSNDSQGYKSLIDRGLAAFFL